MEAEQQRGSLRKEPVFLTHPVTLEDSRNVRRLDLPFPSKTDGLLCSARRVRSPPGAH